MELENKFIIKKSDGSEVNPKAKYFVLRYDKYQSNMLFMLASKKAMVTFAEVIKNDFKELSCDLIKASTGKDYIDDEIAELKKQSFMEKVARGNIEMTPSQVLEYAELKESNTWVSVDERLPDDEEDYLCEFIGWDDMRFQRVLSWDLIEECWSDHNGDEYKTVIKYKPLLINT